MAGREAASRELMLGLIALEAGEVDRETFVAAVRAWGRSPDGT